MELGGFKLQSVPSCLYVLDGFLMSDSVIVSSIAPSPVSEQKQEDDKADLITDVAKVLGEYTGLKFTN